MRNVYTSSLSILWRSRLLKDHDRVVLELGRKILETVWRFHFRIPEWGYWSTSVTGIAVIAIPAANALPVGLFLVSLGGQGIVRWHWHARRSLAMVVTRFSSASVGPGMAAQVQELVMTRLQDNTREVFHPFFHAVPAVVGTGDRRFAIQLLGRLQAHFLVCGRVDARPGGGYSVFARVVQATDRSVLHVDWHTRDRIPAYGDWSALMERLTPTNDVQVGEYPLEFATELEAVVRGIAGQVNGYLGDHGRAEELFREAIAVAPNSTSHQVDQLRAGLANSMAAQGRDTDAIAFLQPRATEDTASPELLRTLFAIGWSAHLSYGLPTDPDDQIALLRRAAGYETDPLRELTFYNLAQQLTASGVDSLMAEGLTILQWLKKTSSYYSKTWYLHRDIGGAAYYDGRAALAAGDREGARLKFALASKGYRAAIRRRPRIKLLFRDGPRLYVLRRFAASPILFANAVDAADGAGQSIRVRWLEGRFRRLRESFLKRSERYLRQSDWAGAYSYGDWAIVGRNDSQEATAHLLKAVAAKQLEDDHRAEEAWDRAFDLEPLTLVHRGHLASLSNLTHGVPGNQPVDEEGVINELVRLGVLVSDSESP